MSDQDGSSPGGSNYEDKREIVEQIKHLMTQDKETILVQVINLTTQLQHQENRNNVLKNTLKEVMEVKEMMQRNLINQETIRSHTRQISEKKSALEEHLTKNYKAISAQSTAIEAVRVQVKQDGVKCRSAIDALNKRIAAINEKEKSILHEYEMNLKRMNGLKAELHAQKLNQGRLLDEFRSSVKDREVLQEKIDSMTKTHRQTIASKEQQLVEMKQQWERDVQQREAQKKDLESQLGALKQTATEQEQQWREETNDLKQRNERQVQSLEEKLLAMKKEHQALEQRLAELQELNEQQAKELESRRAAKRSALQLKAVERTVPPVNVISSQERRRSSVKSTDSRPSSSMDINFDESYHYENDPSEISSASYGGYLRK
ncbi:cytospin-B-like [Anopheles darlingi]|uniref:cytospin-B-like n=1 Tax=Anopheles darlingi TaxID=43151 RepID=UPI0021005136|nr:cytospin-B-like [Anopheles darlingi]